MKVAIALFTRDLRVHDNPVLHAACHAATQVVPLFVLDTAILTGGSMSANRAAFLAEALADLDTQLRDRQGCLVVRSSSVVKEVERIVADLGAPRSISPPTPAATATAGHRTCHGAVRPWDGTHPAGLASGAGPS